MAGENVAVKFRYWKVGGWIRDSKLGLEPTDMDWAVECLPAPPNDGDGGAALFQALCLDLQTRHQSTIVVAYPQFLTLKCKHPAYGVVDVSLCRTESSYTRSRGPDQVAPGTILEDLARRDYTINAMAQDLETGEELDPHHGRDDLDKRIVRAVGEPAARFQEDPLRVLRGVRFAVSLQFTIEPLTLRAMCATAPLVCEKTSLERVRAELDKALAADVCRTVSLLEQLKLLSVLFGGSGPLSMRTIDRTLASEYQALFGNKKGGKASS